MIVEFDLTAHCIVNDAEKSASKEEVENELVKWFSDWFGIDAVFKVSNYSEKQEKGHKL